MPAKSKAQQKAAGAALSAKRNAQVEEMVKESSIPNRGPSGSDRSATQARQGVTGHNVRYVLVFGILGTVLAFAIALAIGP